MSEYVYWGVTSFIAVIAIGCSAACWLLSKKITSIKTHIDVFTAKQNEQDSVIEKIYSDQKEFQNKFAVAFNEFTLRIKSQMFLHESNLLNEKGEWILEHKGEKKIFKPGKIIGAITADNSEESSFKYTDSEVICTTYVKGQIKSELIFSMTGAPKSGKIFEKGKMIREFYYNELGQVVENRQYNKDC